MTPEYDTSVFPPRDEDRFQYIEPPSLVFGEVPLEPPLYRHWLQPPRIDARALRQHLREHPQGQELLRECVDAHLARFEGPRRERRCDPGADR